MSNVKWTKCIHDVYFLALVHSNAGVRASEKQAVHAEAELVTESTTRVIILRLVVIIYSFQFRSAFAPRCRVWFTQLVSLFRFPPNEHFLLRS